MTRQSPLFDWRDGVAYFRGLRAEHRVVAVAGNTFRLAALEDAADLLDEADFAKSFLEEDRAPYGLELWPAAIMLAEYVLLNGQDAGRQAIELGCGVALVSIAAARTGWRVIATDHEPTALRFAEYNASLNNAGIEAYELLDWHHPPKGRRFERILATDVLYQLVDHRPILQCLEKLLLPGGEALVADPNRGVADRFPSMAKSHGFEVTVRPAAAPGPTGRPVAGRIFRLRRATAR